MGRTKMPDPVSYEGKAALKLMSTNDAADMSSIMFSHKNQIIEQSPNLGKQEPVKSSAVLNKYN